MYQHCNSSLIFASTKPQTVFILKYHIHIIIFDQCLESWLRKNVENRLVSDELECENINEESKRKARKSNNRRLQDRGVQEYVIVTKHYLLLTI